MKPPVLKSQDTAPVVSFVLLDMGEGLRLANQVGTALNMMKRVVNGVGLSTPDLQLAATKLIKGEVPDAWGSRAWPAAPDEPSTYLQQLAKKVLALTGEWRQRLTQPNMIFERPVRLSDFLRPDVFLNALRQQTARQLRTAMDNLVLTSKFATSGSLAQQADGGIQVQIEGLLLEGAAFERTQGTLLEAPNGGSLMSTLPNLVVSWSTTQVARQMNEVEIPLYVGLNRERFLCAIWLPTDSPKHRVFNSTAIFLTDS